MRSGTKNGWKENKKIKTKKNNSVIASTKTIKLLHENKWGGEIPGLFQHTN